jgi:hypothetical protein
MQKNFHNRGKNFPTQIKIAEKSPLQIQQHNKHSALHKETQSEAGSDSKQVRVM